MSYKEKLLHPKWQVRKLETYASDNFCCAWCGESEKTLNAHHLRYAKSRNPWDVDNVDLVTLCCDCHLINHFKQFTPLEREIVDELQTMLPLVDKDLLKGLNQIIIKHIKSSEQNGK